MPLSAGDRLGAFEVTGELGSGGMGIVLRARDTKLDRDVALKVLPEAFTSDPDRLARFERDSGKVLASLNHPNIGHIDGLEETADTKALALKVLPEASSGKAKSSPHHPNIGHIDGLEETADTKALVLDFALERARRSGSDAKASGSGHSAIGRTYRPRTHNRAARSAGSRRAW